MLTLIFIAMAITLVFAIIGSVPAALITKQIAPDSNSRGPIALGIAVGTGFALSAIAASWSFGAFGANSYLTILIILGFISIASLAIKPFRQSMSIWLEFSVPDLSLLSLPLIVAILSKPYWTGLFHLQVAAGIGADVPQNLMTVLAQPKVGSTWWQGRKNFLNYLGDPNLHAGLYHIYQISSMQLQAGYDYLIMGTRWGLSIPFSQYMRLNPSYIVQEQGLAMAGGLTSMALLVYAFFRVIKSTKSLSFIFSVVAISSGCFLHQVFNGGIAQVWSLAGLGLLSLGFVLAIHQFYSDSRGKGQNMAVLAILTFGWLANAVTYLDSSMSMAAAFIVILTSIFFFVNRELGLKLAKQLVFSGLIAAILVAPYAYASASTMTIRLRLAGGTGYLFNYWPLPSEILGFFNIWTGPAGQPRDSFIFLLGILISLGIAYLLGVHFRDKNKKSRAFAIIGITIFAISGAVALWAKQTSLGSNYSFVKISTYLSPMFLMALGYLIKVAPAPEVTTATSKRQKKQVKGMKNRNLVMNSALVLVITLVFGTAVITNDQLFKTKAFSIPSSLFNIYHDKAAQKELNTYNYMTTYIAQSNMLGFLADTHWIGKAPNDQRLGDRINIPLRVICLAQDPNCRPPGAQITNTVLGKYGYRVYQSIMTTKEFAALAAKDRWAASFKIVGEAPFNVPARFIGGNPLLYSGK
jgi:hypothetical protein